MAAFTFEKQKLSTLYPNGWLFIVDCGRGSQSDLGATNCACSAYNAGDDTWFNFETSEVSGSIEFVQRNVLPIDRVRYEGIIANLT